MTGYSEALQLIRKVALEVSSGTRRTKRVSLSKALGRVAAEDVLSREMLPALSNSAVDGFAVRSHETRGASLDNPLTFPVVGSVVAGDVPPELGVAPKFSAWEIMTGAPFPQGFDASVKIEDVQVKRDGTGKPLSIEISQESAYEDYLRPAGEDFQIGTSVVKAGTQITAEHIMALSALGFAEVEVQRKLHVALISTGKEIVDHGAELQPGQIRNSTAPYLMSALEQLGLKLTTHVNVGDDPADFFRELGRCIEDAPDMIITTGAVSMGKHDFIPSVLRDYGAEILFHQVAIRPGKPILFAKMSKGPVVFGLPGNPVSSVVGLRFFVEPFLRAWSGRKLEHPLRAKLRSSVRKVEGLQCFFKAQVEMGEGDPHVTVLAGQPSFMIRPLLESSAWAVLPQAGKEISAGEWVDVYPLNSWTVSWGGHSPSPHHHTDAGGCC